ncbi:MAG TPA: hypothetical protein VIE36_00935 [Methylomirabilota bacterium]
MSGWLVGLPFTSAPIAFFLARERGAEFAATAAAGIMAGAVSQAAFCLAYAWTARRRPWPAATAAGCAAFAVATAVLTRVAPPLLALALVVFGALAAAVRAMPPPAHHGRVRTKPPRWDLPARMVVATAFVIALTGVAGALGPRLTGLLAPFPLYAAILTVFAHTLDGAAAAASVLRGLLVGLVAFAGFFMVLAAALPAAGIGIAFAAAFAVALILHGGALWALPRR